MIENSKGDSGWNDLWRHGGHKLIPSFSSDKKGSFEMANGHGSGRNLKPFLSSDQMNNLNIYNGQEESRVQEATWGFQGKSAYGGVSLATNDSFPKTKSAVLFDEANLASDNSNSTRSSLSGFSQEAPSQNSAYSNGTPTQRSLKQGRSLSGNDGLSNSSKMSSSANNLVPLLNSLPDNQAALVSPKGMGRSQSETFAYTMDSTMSDLSPKHPSSPSNASSTSANNLHSLYKTELCRSWEETGSCRYGNKCQFAHGQNELRPIARHPKYKTEICRTFATNGTCPYGTRCRFIHYITSKEISSISSKEVTSCQKASTEEDNSPPSTNVDTWTELLEEKPAASTAVKRTQSAYPRLESDNQNTSSSPSSSRRLPIFERLSFRDLNPEADT